MRYFRSGLRSRAPICRARPPPRHHRNAQRRQAEMMLGGVCVLEAGPSNPQQGYVCVGRERFSGSGMIFGLATFRKDLVPQSAQCLLWSFHPSGQTARNTHPTIGALQSDALPLRPNRCPWLSPPVASIAQDGALRRHIPRHNQTDPLPLMLASEQFPDLMSCLAGAVRRRSALIIAS